MIVDQEPGFVDVAPPFVYEDNDIRLESPSLRGLAMLMLACSVISKSEFATLIKQSVEGEIQ